MTHQQARTEAARCLSCFDAPCTQACPVHIDIPKFISMLKGGNVIGAAEVVKTSHALANVCGKVCPEEVFCQGVCSRGKLDTPILIRELHFFATQEEASRGPSHLRPFPKLGKEVAVVGGGPAGLGCAFELAKLGYTVNVFDEAGLGGVPKRSIPPFRLGNDVVMNDVSFLSPFFRTHNQEVDVDAFGEIRRNHAAVFVSIGLGQDRDLGIPGESLQGVHSVLQFLESAKLRESVHGMGGRVVIVGGGNVSLDAAATAKRLGVKEVVLTYRRSEREMKVWQSELDEARAQGVEFRFLTNPVAIVGEGRVRGLRCRRNYLSGRLDSSGRPIPMEIEGSEFVINADAVIVAIGQRIRAAFVNMFERTAEGYIKVDARYHTSLAGVFSGGDAIAGEGTIVQSVAHGMQAAWAMHDYLTARGPGGGMGS